MDRNRTEPFFTASPCAMREGDTWHLWYASSTGFLKVENRVEPLYVLKYATSKDGIEWERFNTALACTCRPRTKCSARPTVIKESGHLQNVGTATAAAMTFATEAMPTVSVMQKSTRRRPPGNVWTNGPASIIPPVAWDSTMQTYPSVVNTPHGKYLFYNGNGFGKTGMGVARWQA